MRQYDIKTLRMRIADTSKIVDPNKIDSLAMNKAFGVSIRYFRKKSGLTLKQLCEKVYGRAVNMGRMSENETGKNSLSILNITNLCNVFNISLIEFFNRCEIEYKRILED